jgi:hypothetical protein
VDRRGVNPVPASGAGVGLRDLAAAAPGLALAALFAVAWVSPATLGADRVNWLFWTLIIEFLVVHSTGFMAAAVYTATDRAGRLQGAAMFGFPYLVLTVIFALVLKSWWPLVSFWSLTLNRWAGPLVGQAPPGESRELVMVSWVVNMALYCVAIPGAALVPVPELGFATYQVEPESAVTSDDLELHRMMAGGAFYFALTAASELVRHRWVPAKLRRGIERTTRT